MNLIKRITLIISVFCIAMPACAMEPGEGHTGILDSAWNAAKEHPFWLIAGAGAGAAFYNFFKKNEYVRDTKDHLLMIGALPMVGIFPFVVGGLISLCTKSKLSVSDRMSLIPLGGAIAGVALVVACDKAKNYLKKRDEAWIADAKNPDLAFTQKLIASDGYLKTKDYSGNTPLHWAVHEKHFKKTHLLIAHGSDVNAINNKDETPLYVAALRGSKALVQLLLANKANIEAKDYSGDTALHGASSGGQLETVRLLLDHGANIEAKNNYGWTALFFASRAGHVEVVRLLLDRGANIEANDNSGDTALHEASQNGHVEVVRLLLDYGANVEAKGYYGRTALWSACWHIGVVRLLLDHGANVETKDNCGDTVLSVTSRNGHGEGVRLLLQRGQFVSLTNNFGASRDRIKTTLLYLDRQEVELPRELHSKILSYLPEDVLNVDHLAFVMGNDQLGKLISECPFAWFKALYDAKPEGKKVRFLEKIVPAIVEYRMSKLRELLRDEKIQNFDPNNVDPVILTLLDKDNVEQHRQAITKNVMNAFLGLQEEPEEDDNQ